MPVNHADMITLGTFVWAPVAAGVGAAAEYAGWWTPLFVAGGLAAGFGVCYAVRQVAYFILNQGTKAPTSMGWLLMIAYTVVPVAISAAGLTGIWWGARSMAQHLP